MITQRDQLYAYVATLVTILVIVLATLITAAIHPALIGKVEALGIGAVLVGLIGSLRAPNQAQHHLPPPPPISEPKE